MHQETQHEYNRKSEIIQQFFSEEDRVTGANQRIRTADIEDECGSIHPGADSRRPH